MKNIIVGYVLPLFLCGVGLVMFRFESLSLMIGSLFIALAIVIFIWKFFTIGPLRNLFSKDENRDDKKIIPTEFGETTTKELSFEIDHNLKLVHDLGKEIGISPTEPVTLSDVLEKARLVVAENPSPETVHAIREDLYLTEPPTWNCKVFDNLTSLSFLPEKEQQDVRQFYDKLKLITSIYEKLRTSKGESIVEKLENKIESLIAEMLDRGNPLKTT